MRLYVVYCNGIASHHADLVHATTECKLQSLAYWCASYVVDSSTGREVVRYYCGSEVI